MNRNSKSIYMEPIARKYAHNYLRYEPDIVFLHVNHDLNDIIAFHNMISGYFSESVFLTIPYTIGKLEYQRKVGSCENQYEIYRDDTGYYICRDGKIVCDTGSSLQVQMRDMFAVALDVIYKDLKGKKLLILEDGGYHYSAFEEIKNYFPGLGKMITGCVEQTRNGIRAYSNCIKKYKLNYPVVTVARSRIKMGIEAYYIANSAVELTDEFLKMIGETLYGRDTLIIGYGAIGRSLSRILETYKCRQRIIEIDEDISEVAREEGKVCVDAVDRNSFERETVLIGTTGNASFSGEMLTSFLYSDSCTLTLVSISSKQMEFQKFYFCLSDYKYDETDICIGDYYLGKTYEIYFEGRKKSIRVFANGYPINFFCKWKKSLPESVIDMIYAEMIYSLKVILDSDIHLENQLYMMGDKYPFFEYIEEEILREWDKPDVISTRKQEGHFFNCHPREEYLRHCF